jgi:tRNA-modifying protein YgfZ
MIADVTITSHHARELVERRRAVPVEQAVFRLEGPGTIDCLQGVLTNDVVAAGPQSLIWGAVLTPKGMIVADLWVARRGVAATVFAPIVAREQVYQLFTRSFPPRLTRVTDVTGRVAVRWLLGGAPMALDEADLLRPHGPAPFTALVVTEQPHAADDRLAEAGWESAPAGDADAIRLLLGWPTLGREIDDRTLPQEVRMDELGGVRYDKGCYTGQETVARVHFRGHTNRALRGIAWEADAEPHDRELVRDGKAVGSVRTTGTIGDSWIALGMVRREVDIGESVLAGGAPARVVDLPFTPGELAVA